MKPGDRCKYRFGSTGVILAICGRFAWWRPDGSEYPVTKMVEDLEVVNG